ncbi:MAG: transglycosylase family protein [Negativicutes bacterium]|nr:transglycosylase family protein [Negativicutes bacterium]
MSLFDTIAQAESGGQLGLTNPIMTSSGHAQGLYQITTGTWNDFAPAAGVDLSQYPTPNQAPADIQTQVAGVIPLSRWAPSTLAAVQNTYGNLDTSQTVNTLASQTGGTYDPLGAAFEGSTGGDTYAPGAAPSPSNPSGGSLYSGGAAASSNLSNILTTSFARIAVVVVGVGVLIVGLTMLRTGQSPVQIVSSGTKKALSRAVIAE